jgi:hypothetical protein
VLKRLGEAAVHTDQSQAFAYRDLIGELRYAQRLRSRSVARCRFYIAQARPWPEDPVPLDSDEHDLSPQLAADALVNFQRIPFDHEPDGFTARLDENLGIAGDEVITTAFTFGATAAAARLTGATVVFADIDPDTLCLDPDAAAAAITPRTAAILPVHIYTPAGQESDQAGPPIRQSRFFTGRLPECHSATSHRGQGGELRGRQPSRPR